MDWFIAFSKAHHQSIHSALSVAVTYVHVALQFTVNQLGKSTDISHLNHSENIVALS